MGYRGLSFKEMQVKLNKDLILDILCVAPSLSPLREAREINTARKITKISRIIRNEKFSSHDLIFDIK